ncbi:orotate phosphoribosyltransferase [Flavobacterium branchiophilum NBRC 15030 = ATCC 35035]|uniref:Orotate phosphoribosyltransferase n=2 Tax=Flavobacterium branchiophilum TaxID=55197 RepID=G2Z1F9_FLABF|nr:orotate phosphoribosyltransferase [Flavobacterium branchiophilum]OXA70714.1 orotate phosphoribosyltransferase [Flavobacterium branchiophilum NBRC 15030 = ATCC 35035]PDS25176.1 orotate phosphoribosyltransferase [Flavobacterium branchiophilum]TQM42176.1 orotate phosphoribosyltransferase [Flavobacterium branchiophilum]CCB69727.1 Orotate phosphoribosyltransferase [Flavobacterium branchiophilum FL-15]GEM54528.1 orotate phosphoribosyltransferase [Flavobacterium branchiophilum NBRC 15030 = ATCC 35
MIFNKDTAEKTAELLLQINAIKLNPRNPFLWASGWNSPIYCDNRLTLSFPAIRNYVRDEFVKNIEKKFGKPDVIAGVATGAIGIGILVAESLGLPFVYVRPEPKKHGRQNQIEGFLQKGQNVIVVEDLISTGNSSLQAVEALKAAGANVKAMVAIFNYGFDVASNNFKNANLDLFTLSNYESLLTLAVSKQYITEEEEETLKLWRENPATWGK